MKNIAISFLSLFLFCTGSAWAQNPQGFGCAPYKLFSASSTNATLVAAGKHTIKYMHYQNINAAVKYLKFYDNNKSPTCGTDTPVLTLAMQGSTVGLAREISIYPGIAFQSGIALCITGALADNDTTSVTANEQVVNLCYD